jgi:CHAT domain-containing protein
MIQNHNVKYVPSLTSLILLNEPADDYERQMLAVAGSWLPAVSVTPAPERNTLFAPLPAALVEVDSVTSHFNRITKLKDEKMSEATLKQLMSDEFRFIHLATHGIINEEHPAKSGLLISEKEQDSLLLQDDGMLRSSEIYRLNIPAEMVVLSACNTGLGKVVKGEGMLGLQRSFFYAGVSTVVASLWNVYDRSTAFMMNEFYKSILKRENEDSSWYSTLARWTGWDTSVPFGMKAKAMRDTKLTLLNHERFNHPVYWAPFIVVGR